MARKNTNLVISLSPDIADKLREDRWATKEIGSISWLIESLLRDYYQKRDQEQKAPPISEVSFED